MQVILPHMMEVLQDDNRGIKVKALLVFRNVVPHLTRKEASPFAVQLAEELLPLFDDVRLMWETEPCRGALGNKSCPSAQPCWQPCGQGLLPSSLPWALVGWLLGIAAGHGCP